MTILDPKAHEEATRVYCRQQGMDPDAVGYGRGTVNVTYLDATKPSVAHVLTAYLAALPPAGELVPVAWRWRELVNPGSWILTHRKPSQHDAEAEPLYDAATIAALQAALGEAERELYLVKNERDNLKDRLR